VPKAQLKVELFNIPLLFCSFLQICPLGKNKLGNHIFKRRFDYEHPLLCYFLGNINLAPLCTDQQSVA
jgi:hypothetical protein